MKKTLVFLFFFLACIALTSLAQTTIVKTNFIEKSNLQTVNREATVSKDNQGKPIVYINAKPGPGVAWIKDLMFSTGIIEFDVKGKDVFQKSFVGMAFHSVNDSTYEGIYFRPFNFNTTDTIRKNHAVQYISLPKFDWFYLRETYPEKFENPVLNPVNPDSWFHVKIVIENNRIQAFTNSDTEACLTVEPLTHNKSGKLGFWVGNDSDGYFTNLVIMPNK